MPLIKSAKKQMRQNLTHRLRNYRVREKLRVTLKELHLIVKNDTKEDAEKALKVAYKVIDTASKKKILHPNNADRKKASMAKLVAHMGAKQAEASAAKAKIKVKTSKKATTKNAPKEVEASDEAASE